MIILFKIVIFLNIGTDITMTKTMSNTNFKAAIIFNGTIRTTQVLIKHILYSVMLLFPKFSLFPNIRF